MKKLLGKKGFHHDTSEGSPICRWVYRGLKVDFMASDESVFGFTNKWYREGIERVILISSTLPVVRIFSLPYFLGTKIEAFKNRGKNDYQASPDMEDIISVLEVSPTKMWKEGLLNSTPELHAYLKTELSELMSNSIFLDALPGAIFNRESRNEAVHSVLARMEQIMSTS